MATIIKLTSKIKNNEKLALLIFFILTIIIRSVYVLIIYNKIGKANWGDSLYYISLGERIADGNWALETGGASSMIVGPFIPFVVALFVKLFNNPIVPFLIYNIIASSLVVPVLFQLGREIFGTKTGWLLSIWGILNSEYFRYNADVLKESTLYLLVPLTLLLLVKTIKNNNNFILLILSAFSFVLLIHTDERYFIYFPVFCLIFFLIRPFNIQRSILKGFYWSLIVFLFMLPWNIHNYMLYKQVVIISPRTTSLTTKLWGKDISGMNSFRDIFTNDNKERKSVVSHPAEGGKLYLKTFINIWQPSFFFKKRVQYSWYPDPVEQKWSLWHNISSLIFYGFFLPFYILGLAILIKHGNLLGLFIGAIPLIHSFIHTYMIMPDERYRSPLGFIVTLIGLFTLVELASKIKRI